MKLKQEIDRSKRGNKWKITSIRIPFDTAQKVETMGLKAKVRSATETIIQILEAATAGVKALPAKKLAWAKKPDASARKQYAAKPKKVAKPAPKKKVQAKAKKAARKAAPKRKITVLKSKKAVDKHVKKVLKSKAAPKAEPKAAEHKPEMPNGTAREEQHENAVETQ